MLPLPSGFKPAGEPDAALQKTVEAAPARLAPTLGLNFEGLGEGFPNYLVFVAPPDPNGAVGKTQYVQWVNLSFAVFDKATGSVLPNFPVPGNTLWQGFGGACETDNNGDPIVTYDKLADRWVFTQLAGSNSPFLQCVAVSTTSDATGTYNRYSFLYSSFNDYPKLGVWPDAYYITFNIFSPTSFIGAEACAYDRNAMLNGTAASQICFPPDPTVLGLLPADVDGLVPPPGGSPNFMLSFGVNSLDLFKFHVDFATPGNSTLTGPTSIPVTAFTPFLCNGSISGCVPQPPGDSTRLDSLGDRLMYRLAYRNFGDHESLVVNHSVIADSVNLNSGVRWYEIQDPNGTPTIAQQSTFAPDASYRWMGSVAMDAGGNLAVGYSVSSSSVSPSIAFAGRGFADPPSTLQAEVNLFSGTGSQTNGLTRWGDYSAMQVDPVDDCTFWYTQEYLANSGSFNWNTRIANFKFGGCLPVLLSIALSHAGNFTQGQGFVYTITVTNNSAGQINGVPVTVTDTLPAGLSFLAGSTVAFGAGWTCPPATSSTVSCTRSDQIPAGTTLPPITVQVGVDANAPALVINTATVNADGNKDLVHNTASDPTTVIQTGPDLAITKTHVDPFIQGQPGTYSIAVSNVGLSPTDGTTVTVSDPLPSGVTFNSASGPGWTCAAGPPVTCARSDALASGGSYPLITLTVNVAGTAQGAVLNTASVSGGGDTNPLNNNASDLTHIIPPPPDLTITKTHTGNFNQGQQNAQYTLTVSNLSGGATVGTVVVTDTLPTGLTVSPFSAGGFGWGCQMISAVSVTCKQNNVLSAGKSYPPITLNVNVANNAPASVVNMATVSGGNDITPGNNTARDTTIINPAPDLTVAMSHKPEPFVVGQPGTYTITVSNVGGAATSGVVNVNGSLPFGSMTATSVTGTGWSCDTGNPQAINCTRADVLAAGGSYPSLTVTVSVNGGGPAVTNTVSVSGGGEFNTTNDSASDLTHITAPVLAITKTHTGDFSVGVPGVYTITVSNTGPIATAGTVNVTDFLPAGMSATSVSGSGWNCPTVPTSFLNCTRSDSLPANQSYPALNVTVNITSASPTETNTANVQGGGDTTTRSASDTANVNTPTLAISKTHSGNFVVGQDAIYQITVSNTGKVATAGTVTVTDFLSTFQPALTLVAVGGPGWTCSAPPAVFVTCTRTDPLVVGASYPPIILTVNIASAGSTLTNSASVTGGGDALTHTANDTANVSGPALNITKSHTGTFTGGQNGTYTINVSNVGQVATVGTVTVQDFLPSGLTATAATGTGWSCSPLPTIFLNCTRSDSLSTGSSYPALTVTVSITTSGSITNTASVSGGGDASNHNASDTVIINPGPVLSITKTHSGNFTVGQNGTYTITVGNTGQLATSGVVTVQDALVPFGLSVTAISGSGWSCNTLPTSFLSCTRSDALNPGASYPALVVTVSVGGGAPSFINTANVTGGGDSQTHTAADPTTVIGPTLGITKSHTPDPFIVGQTGTYTITVDDKAGQSGTQGSLTVVDFVPPGLSVNAISGTGWTCSATSVTCTRSDALAAGQSYPPIALTVNVNGGGPQTVNLAEVSGAGDPQFHTANDITNITAPVLAITKSHTPDPFVAGQQGTYTITVSNKGTVATAGAVTVADNLPTGLTLSSSSGAGWGCTGVTFITCTRSDSLAASASYPPLVLTVNIVNSVSTIINTASVTGGGDSSTHAANDTANVTVPLLAITKSHTGNFTVGQPATYTIGVSNVGTVATTGTVTVTDFLPFPLVANAVNGSGWGCSALPTSFLTCTRADSLAGSGASYPPLQVTVGWNGTTSIPSSVTNTASVTGGGDGLNHNASDPTTILTPALAISKTHSGTFTVGQSSTYTITVSNTGTVPTFGTVFVDDTLPAGLTASVTGSGWACPGGSSNTSFECSRSDALAGGGAYPPITAVVNLDPSTQSPVVNQARLSGGGDSFAHTATDTAAVTFPDLAVSMSHTGNFFVGEQGASYSINVSNVGSLATVGGTLTVVDPLPIGIAATSASGSGWACSIFNGPQTEVDCTRPAAGQNPGTSYPPIAVVASVSLGAPSTLTNSVTLFGISESNYANNTASDPTIILPIEINPTSNSSVTVTAGSSATYSFQVNLGTNPSPGSATFSVAGLPANTTVSFTPSSLTQAGVVTMTVNTSGNGHVASLRLPGSGWFAPMFAAVLVPVLGFLLIAMRNTRQRKWAWVGVSICGLLLVVSLASCGGGSGPGTPTPTPTPIPTPTPTPAPTPTPTPPPSTPPGTYTLTVTATTSNGTANTPVTLVVQ
jgi:uncharacterized repeat protein (TIGR01451 family)